ncbi:hypothetical protein CYMTET_27860 [Cymbomonas tetramitiformis]|uniref:Fatty acid desaturase domain-containing protein n=1 Tax=Cymbomonas tetramitiformis TaxID=36881 RepID=A0AAE0FPI3_9CHLO|nr:hypothetical protein CYMTET_27860 [Cymbomonas tetramitiformis]
MFLQRFILGLHYSEHRRMFKNTPGGTLLNCVAPFLLAPFYGIPCGVYKSHHVLMHHVENNLCPHDLSGTDRYQRDNFLHFLFYLCRYMFAIWVELPYYMITKGRYTTALSTFSLASSYLMIITLLYQVKPIQTLWVFVVPFLVSSLALMFGNWSQHIFVNPDNHTTASDYSNTYNCLNTPDNQKSFNDGYHIVHHVNARCHWSDMPSKFLDLIQEHINQDGLVFKGVGFFEVGLAVMTRQLWWLANRTVDLQIPTRTQEEKIAMLKKRLAPVHR